MFLNTMDRHLSGQRPDVQDPVPLYGHEDHGNEAVFAGHEICRDNQLIHQTDMGVPKRTELSLSTVFDKFRISEEEKSSSRGGSEAPQSFNQAILDEDKSAVEASISGRLYGDANDLATSKNPSTSNDTSRSSPLDGLECFSSRAGKAYHAPRHYFSHSSTGLEENRNGDSGGEPVENSGYIEGCSYLNQNWDEEQSTNEEQEHPSFSSPISWSSEDAYSAYRSIQASSSSLEPSNSLSDLSGDYESHITSLQYGQWYYDYAPAAQVPPHVSATFVSELQGKSKWDAVRRSVQNKHMTFSRIKTNGLIPSRPFYPMNSQLIQVRPFGVEEMRKTRGTGMYFPNPSTVICSLLCWDVELCSTWIWEFFGVSG